MAGLTGTSSAGRGRKVVDTLKSNPCTTWEGEVVRGLSVCEGSIVTAAVVPAVYHQEPLPFNLEIEGKEVVDFVFPSGTTAVGMLVSTSEDNLYKRQTIGVPGFWVHDDGEYFSRLPFQRYLEKDTVPLGFDFPCFNPCREGVLARIEGVLNTFNGENKYIYILRDTDRVQIGIYVTSINGLQPIYSRLEPWTPAPL
jgi:hypothetical protein